MEPFRISAMAFLKKRGAFVAGCAVLAVAVAACAWILLDGSGDIPSISIRASYEPMETRHIVDVSQRIGYVNNTGASLEEIYLHLYPLAYAQDGDQQTRIDSIRVNGTPAEYALEGTAIRIPLPERLGANGSARIEMDYTLDVPENDLRYGAGAYSLNLLNAFAIPAVYEGGAWRTDSYSEIGDPFYSEIADYDVELSAPEGTVIAATGTTKSEKTAKSRVTYRFDAPAVRDFAAVLMRECAVAQGNVGDVRIVSYAPDAQSAERALGYAARTIEAMTLLFGPCDYREVEVCAADLFSGGMEYPGVAVISTDLYQPEQEAALEYCVAHEVAHQWWYGAVGNDQIRAPWLDESLAEYSTLLYFEQAHGPSGFQGAYRRFIRPQLMRKGLASEPIERPITAFDDHAEYAAIVYAKGAAMWHALRQEMGDDAFFAALRQYYDENMRSIATKQDLYDVLGGDWAAFIEEWLTGRAP